MQNKDSPHVLYIEDHEDTRELVTLVLEQKSIEVVTGTTIKSGVALASSQEFDLYLLDSWLPDGSGLELCKRIREFDKTTPILFYLGGCVRDGSRRSDQVWGAGVPHQAQPSVGPLSARYVTD